MIGIAILSFGVLALSLAIAGFLMARAKTLIGIILGVVPIALMVFLARWSIQANITRCLEDACTSAGLPAGCGISEFGCTEWSGLGLALIAIAGLVDLVLYIVGVIMIAVVQYRRGQG
jgi:hypothetical protein